MHIFVGGTGRCGTSVLGLLLGASPDVLYFQEPRFISDPGGIYDYVSGVCSAVNLQHHITVNFRERLANGIRPAKDGFWSSFYSTEFVTEALKRHLIGEDRFADARELIDYLFCTGMRAAGRKCWVEKTPHTVRHCDLLWRIFPNMRYVHVFRDPRDIYCSVRKFHWGPNTPEEFVKWYQSIMNDAIVSQKNLPPHCYMSIDLADIAGAPMSMTHRMLQFCGLPHDDASVALCADKIDIEKCHLGRWKTELNKAGSMLITAHCLPIYAQWRELSAGLVSSNAQEG